MLYITGGGAGSRRYFLHNHYFHLAPCAQFETLCLVDLLTYLLHLVTIEWLLYSETTESGIFGVECIGDDGPGLCVVLVVVTDRDSGTSAVLEHYRTPKYKQSGVFSSET